MPTRMGCACDFSEPGKSTSARTFNQQRKSDHNAGVLADFMMDALENEASRDSSWSGEQSGGA
jgi:hypothetical protein